MDLSERHFSPCDKTEFNVEVGGSENLMLLLFSRNKRGNAVQSLRGNAKQSVLEINN